MAELRGRKVAMIFQNPAASLNPVLTIGYQMIESLRRHQQPSADPEAAARDTLRAVGIGNPERVLRSYPFQLSGGMNQRVMIAMAMSARPELLIADEPTTALDVTTQAQVLEQLRELTHRYQTSLILITHDIALVAEYTDLVLVMYAGEVCEFGPVGEVVNDRATRTRGRCSSRSPGPTSRRAPCCRRSPASCPTRRGSRPDARSRRGARW